MNTIKFGITQGRLTESKSLQSIPENWKREFKIANDIGYDYVELITLNNKDNKNPLFNLKNQTLIKNLIKKNSKLIKSIVCDTYIINHSISSVNTKLYYLNLIKILFNIKCEILIVPINNFHFSKKQFLKKIYNFIKFFNLYSKNKIKIFFEFDLKISDIKKIVNYFDEKDIVLSLVFDTGNHFKNNKNFYKEIKDLKKYIKMFHFKSRNLKNKNIKFSNGLVNFDKVVKILKEINFEGNITFESSRGSDPIKTAKENLKIIHDSINKN